MYHFSLPFCRDLQVLDERTAKKCERMEAAVREEEVRYWHNIAQLLEQNKACAVDDPHCCRLIFGTHVFTCL